MRRPGCGSGDEGLSGAGSRRKIGVAGGKIGLSFFAVRAEMQGFAVIAVISRVSDCPRNRNVPA